uniref:TOG domain-containing protein n=1 Tax=Panagrolaimus sp. ES5 TaxID=591445 RepID=A0AC34GDM7_9BILA
MVASKKWKERKEGLDGLLKLATDNIRLDPKANYNEIVDTLSKILAKDANIIVCAIAAKCITQLAKGLRTKFGPHVSTFTPIIFEKFKEKKPLLRDALIEAIDALYAATTIDALCDDIVAALGKPNPNIKIQANQFLCRVFKSFNAQNAPKKVVATLTPLIAKCTGASDQEAREASFAALGTIMKALGKSNAMAMLDGLSLDKAKMERIEKFYNDAVEEAKEEEENKRAAAQPTSAPAESKASVASEDTIYLTKLLANVQEVIASKKCQERKDGLDGLLNSATDNIRLAPVVENLS